MKIKTKNLVILLVIGLVFPLILNHNFNFSNNYNPTVDNPKTSATYNGIWINDKKATNGSSWGNWTWARTQPWCTEGNGTQENPYIIKNSIFLSAGPSDCLYIEHSRKYFVIKNCTFKDIPFLSFAGLRLNNVTNANIIDNQVYNNAYGIDCLNVNNSQLINNNCSINTKYGIHLDDCYYNMISGNTANGNDESGIYLYEYCDNNNISGNSAVNNYYGISLDWDCDNNTISGNTANDNDEYGIYLYDLCDNNTISGNTANDNKLNGIELNYDNFNNNISGNTANNNTRYGIHLSSFCNNNTISGNNASDNTQHGIYLDWYCDNNTITGNTACNNTGDGIYLTDNCDYNTISGNTLSDNNYGMYIESNCDNNTIHENFFLKNGKHAFDLGTDNKWNSTTIGNYWDNHTGPDVNVDGIVDIQYNISGSAGSIDYLPIAEDGAPTITINSPDPGDVFDNTAPSFNVRITDDYLDEMWWYTIDGGLTNYTFTANGTIDQTAWGMASEGDITITFYASDIFGHIGSAEIIILKDYEAPVININSPTIGEYFGSSAPSFNVQITDDYINTMWYTLDGGLNNYTFTGNGTLEQSAWNAMGDGTITLQFYANDTLGHTGSAGVNIIKDTVAPIIAINSPDPGEIFGNDAPSFNVTVTDLNLESVWLVFEGVTLNLNNPIVGTINDTVWSELPEGNYTITFHARDLAGNEASEAIMITKDVPSKAGIGLDYFMTSFLIFIMGGMAIIVIITRIHLKKRVTLA